MRRFIEALAGGLRPDLDVETATDIYVALERQEIYEVLVLERGWSHGPGPLEKARGRSGLNSPGDVKPL
jgi:hypothetical protein